MKLTILRIADEFIPSPRIRNPIVSSAITSAVAAINAAGSLAADSLRAAEIPAVTAAKKLMAELMYPSQNSPITAVLAIKVVTRRRKTAPTSHPNKALSRNPTFGNLHRSFKNKKTPPSK